MNQEQTKYIEETKNCIMEIKAKLSIDNKEVTKCDDK